MWELDYKESWAPKIDAFEWWCWRRLLRVPWTARRSNQSILEEISPGCSLEGMMLKLKLQYFGHLMQRADSFEKTLMLGKIEGRRRRGQQRLRWLDGIIDSMDIGLGRLWKLVMEREASVLWFMGSQRVGHDWVTELNWTEPFIHKYWYQILTRESPPSTPFFCTTSEDCGGSLTLFEGLWEHYFYRHLIRSNESQLLELLTVPS